jgi:hypothetical protein
MAPVEFLPIGEGPRFSGPWVRSAREIEENWRVLGVLVDQILARPDRAFGDFSYGERYTLGVRAAARWSLGLEVKAPLTAEPAPVDGANLVAELAVAEYLADGDTPASGPAAGVWAWLAWLTGSADRMVFLAL